jgi:hypothetical protein
MLNWTDEARIIEKKKALKRSVEYILHMLEIACRSFFCFVCRSWRLNFEMIFLRFCY